MIRLKFHPKKGVVASVSDDKVWKMWAFPSGELIMSGEGHKDWIADCDFHPKYMSWFNTRNSLDRGTHLATASGDGTVKLWDFSKSTATLTLSDHTQGVWGCAFHDTGDFLASCSMDHTAKLWDLTRYRIIWKFTKYAHAQWTMPPKFSRPRWFCKCGWIPTIYEYLVHLLRRQDNFSLGR